MQKLSIPKGTRDFTPAEMLRREYIFNTIREVFRTYGYSPIETPAMENLSTLLGKYGEEGDKLLFKILNSGDYLNKGDKNALENEDSSKYSLSISKKGLRFDLTVPFARYVVQHRNDINFPFKRYQIQPVWRADRPQRGRYQEFYQCDADIIGSNSLLNEIELIQIIQEVFERLKIRVSIKINNRKILAGIAEVIGYPNKLLEITNALDKIEKRGNEYFVNELISYGLSSDSIAELQSYLVAKNLLGSEYSNLEKIGFLKSWLLDSAIGNEGIRELEYIINMFSTNNFNPSIEVDLALARGLNYYTGTIIEVKARNVQIGSICGGGRYDNLTGIFGFPDLSGVGISFGADRIYDIMNQMKLYPAGISNPTDLMILNFGEKETIHCINILQQFRKANISVLFYPDFVKIQKQMIYANKENIPYVLSAGENEIKLEKYKLRNMQSGEEQQLTVGEIIGKLSASKTSD